MANIYDDLLNEEKTTTPATEQMRQKFNAIIAKHQLSGMEVLHMLARISAGYINHLQRAYTKQGIEVVIEEEFQKRMTVYLTALDMNNVVEEMGKLANKEKKSN